MPTRQTVLIISILTPLLLYLLVHRFATSTSAAVPHVPSHGAKKPAFRQRLVAVGDLHGDIENARTVLRMAHLIDSTSHWIGGEDILVQTGDIVDRGTYAGDIYKLMRQLRGEASAVGGKVVSILGNHEVMNAIGDWRYVTQADIKTFGSVAKRQQALSTEGWLGQEWLANYSTTALVSLGPHPSAPALSFTHGSLRPSFPNLTPYPDNINALGHSLLSKSLTPPLNPPYPPNPYKGLPKDATHSEMELYAEGGPYWWRGLAERDEDTACSWVEEVKKKTGARRIIGGHTPNFEKIVARCNASIIIIDTGISSAYGGVLSALEVIYTLTPIDDSPRHEHDRQDPLMVVSEAQGSESRLEGLKGRYWEREEVHAIYEKRRKWIALEEREVTI